MDMKEFDSMAVRTEDNNYVYFDVRPFGPKQGETIDSFLRNLLVDVRGHTTWGRKTLVLRCDSTADIPQSASNLLQQLTKNGLSVEVEII
jgi:hypothetical protein